MRSTRQLSARGLLAIMILPLIGGACGNPQPAVEASPAAVRPGPLGDTWMWDGRTWHRAATSGPAARYEAGMAYDAADGTYVLYGGQTVKGASDETWIWDGHTWKQKSASHKPPRRRSAAIAYDPAHKVVVLYGGDVQVGGGEGQDGNDMWTWDGNDWTEVAGGPFAPGRRDGPGMVTAGNQVLLFGGHNSNVNYFGDTFAWNGRSWNLVDASPRPPGRGNASMTWMTSQSSLFVFGGTGFNAAAGIGANGSPLGDAWVLRGSTWTQVPASGPPPLTLANAIWAASKGRVIVLFGMPCPKPSGDAWAWDGSSWSKVSNLGIPARWGAASAQAPDGKAMLFGGSNEPGC